MYRLLIVDRRPLFADGIRRIADDAGLAVTEVVRAGPADFAHTLADTAFDAAVVSIAAPNALGIEPLRRLTRLPGAPPVLVVSGPCESVHGVRFLRLGARSIIGAQASPQEIAAALARTLAGRRHVSAALADHLVAHFVAHVVADREQKEIGLRDAVASDAQLRMIQLLALGKPMEVICNLLRISAEDARAQRREILRRTGLADEQELKRCAFEQQLVPDRRAMAVDGSLDNRPGRPSHGLPTR